MSRTAPTPFTTPVKAKYAGEDNEAFDALRATLNAQMRGKTGKKTHPNTARGEETDTDMMNATIASLKERVVALEEENKRLSLENEQMRHGTASQPRHDIFEEIFRKFDTHEQWLNALFQRMNNTEQFSRILAEFVNWRPPQPTLRPAVAHPPASTSPSALMLPASPTHTILTQPVGGNATFSTPVKKLE